MPAYWSRSPRSSDTITRTYPTIASLEPIVIPEHEMGFSPISASVSLP